MKKTRILSLVLALLMCVGMATVFSSCAKKDGDVRLSRKVLEIDLSDYALVYAENDNNKDGTTFRNAVVDFGNKIQETTGLRKTPVAQARADDSRGGKEILIGLTDRDESVKAYEKIKGHGFTIEVTDNKIVIVGTTRLLTLSAVQYFAKNYLTAETPNTVISVNKTAKAKKLDMITLGATDVLDMKIVYDNDMDDTPGAEYGSLEGAREGFGYDYVYERAEELRTYLVKATGVNGSSYSLKNDTQAADGAEIIMGITNRDACASVLSKLSVAQYGVFTQDGNIVATAWSDVGLQLVSDMFIDLVKESKVVDEEDETKVSYLFPANFELIRTCNNDWVLDFPKPEGENISLFNTMDCSDGAFQHLYRGSGVNMAAFDAYCEQLRIDGYTAVSGPFKVEGSAFATYTNKYKNVMVHVSLDAFSHAAELNATSYANSQNPSQYPIVFTGAADSHAQPGLRIISTKLDNAYIDETLFEKKNTMVTNRLTDAAVVAVKLDAEVEKSVGTGYVIMLEDASFIVIDGGARGDVNKDGEADNIFNILSSLHAEYATGAAIHIRAWVNSHAHSDHTAAFYRFAEKYGKGQGGISVNLDYVIASYPSKTMSYNTAEGGDTPYESVKNGLLKSFKTEPKIIEPRTGQRLYFPGLVIEVLFTNEDLNPQGIVTGNDASTLLRFTLTPTTKKGPQKDAAVSFMWTGDMYRYGGQWACAMYGDYLKSDMVALGHHGGPSIEEQFYDFVDADILWWPNEAISVCGAGTMTNPTGGYLKRSDWNSKVDQHAFAISDYIFTATDYNIALFFGVDGPLFDEIKDITNGVKELRVSTDHDHRNFCYKHLLSAQ